MHRYRCLLFKYWWVVALTLSLAVCLAAAYEMTRPPTYMSSATLSVDVESRALSVGGEQGSAAFTQQVEDFVASETVLMKDRSVLQLADEQLQAKHPGEKSSPVELEFTPRNNLLTIEATGTDPVHTQHYLEARIAGLLAYRSNSRNQDDQNQSGKINIELQHLEDALKADDAAIIAYQQQVGVVFPKDAPSSNNSLAALQAKLAELRDRQEQLKVMTPEQGFEHSSQVHPGGSADATIDGSNSAQARAGLEASPAEADYRMAQADLVKLQAQMDDFSRNMRPKHPKIIALDTAIKSDQKLIASLLEQNRANIQNQMQLVASMIQSTQNDIKAAEPKTLENDLLRAKFDTLQEQKQRDLKTYDDLQTTLRNANLTNKVDLDSVKEIGSASPPEPVPSSWMKALAVAILGGLLSGLGILVLIDRMDDRMGSISDFQQHFAEHVMGQIPRDPAEGNTELLRPDDERHMLVESFRNLRSTLLFMPLEGQRPKTLLITSAIPNEGKSTVSSNLALVLASAGMKTLLIDADLRRGAIHAAFGLKRDPGLTDVLRHNVSWETAVRPTNVENLYVLPRGRNVPQPSEYLLSRATDQLLQDVYDKYDYIIIDSSPILAADDTASLAPKIDATLFVVRLSFTSAKLTRKSLEILYNRQANIPGLILNQVDTSSPEFVYYQYSEYYNTATDEEPVAKAT